MRTVLALFRLLQEENLNTKVAFSLAGPEGERPTVLPGPLYSHNSGSEEHQSSQSNGEQMTGEARAADRLAVSPPAQTTSEDKCLLGAWMPTKSRRDFCFPRLIGENRALHGAPFIYRTHWQARQCYLGITVRSQGQGNLLIYFLSNL